MRTLLQDARYSILMLLNHPGLPAVMVLTLALGIAANSTIFSWINATLLDPIPGVAHTTDLVTVMRGDRSDHPTPPFSYLDYRDLRGATRSFSGLLAYHHEWANLTGAGKPEHIYAVLTSANYFDVIGVRPVLGRSFAPAEESEVEGSAAMAVISYELWRSHFGGDRSIIDRRIEINRYPYTIVGVAPLGFHGCMPGLRGDIWIPLVSSVPICQTDIVSASRQVSLLRDRPLTARETATVYLRSDPFVQFRPPVFPRAPHLEGGHLATHGESAQRFTMHAQERRGLLLVQSGSKNVSALPSIASTFLGVWLT